MFKRFTERARRVIILAREEAELYRHEYLGTEHILQGVVKDGGGIAVAIIQKSGTDLTHLKKELEKNLPRSTNSLIIGDIPFTSRAKKVLEFAVEEARSLNHNYIGTEHLLLGLLKEKEGVACRVFRTYARCRSASSPAATSGRSHQHEPPTTRSTWSIRRRKVCVLTSSQHRATPTVPAGVSSTPSSFPPM